MGDEVRVLVVDDQEAEITIYQHAFRRCGVSNTNLFYAHDGQEVIDWLSGAGQYHNRKTYPFPTCMLLDLKMPRIDGFGVLKWMLDHPNCRVIPTIMMSNSGLPADVKTAYMLGVNAYFTKPTRLSEMVDVLALIHHFWTVSQKPDMGPASTCG